MLNEGYTLLFINNISLSLFLIYFYMLFVSDKKKVIRKLHSVLTCQTEKTRSECINRDENSVNNMIKLVKYYLLNKNEKEIKNRRPLNFRRDYKIEDADIKVANRYKKPSSMRTSSKDANPKSAITSNSKNCPKIQ
jgi:hypothetical protein